jgi:hypothetical protein
MLLRLLLLLLVGLTLVTAKIGVEHLKSAQDTKDVPKHVQTLAHSFQIQAIQEAAKGGVRRAFKLTRFEFSDGGKR